jgi:hypothetical protein
LESYELRSLNFAIVAGSRFGRPPLIARRAQGDAPRTMTLPGLPQLETLAQAEAQNLRRVDALIEELLEGDE